MLVFQYLSTALSPSRNWNLSAFLPLHPRLACDKPHAENTAIPVRIRRNPRNLDAEIRSLKNSLLSAGTNNVKYRRSTTGAVWTASTVASEPDTRTYAIGVAYDGRPMAAYVIRGTDKVYDAYEANDQ